MLTDEEVNEFIGMVPGIRAMSGSAIRGIKDAVRVAYKQGYTQGFSAAAHQTTLGLKP